MPLVTKEALVSLSHSILSDLNGATSYINYDGSTGFKVKIGSYNTVYDTGFLGGVRHFNTYHRGIDILKNLPTLIRDCNDPAYQGWGGKQRILAALMADFTYHWLYNFRDIYNDLETLKARVADPLLCVSPATMMGVSYILATYPEKRKELLKDSYYSWIKRGEYWAPTKFYTITPEKTLRFIVGNPEYFNADPSSTRSVKVHLLRMITSYQEENRTQRAVEVLKSYNSKATEYFEFKQEEKKKHTTFLGVELELEGFSAESLPALNTIDKHAIFKRDGSLTHGVEICTRPATLEVHKQEFLKFFTENTVLRNEDTCGLHVHVDKRDMTKLHLANLHMFMNSDSNEEQIVKIAGRPANRFCSKTKLQYFNFNGFRVPDSNRYVRINHQNANTVEFRLFASTTSFEDFCKRLEFTQAVVDYTKPGAANVSVKDITNWGHFQTWVTKNRGLYPTLAKEI